MNENERHTKFTSDQPWSSSKPPLADAFARSNLGGYELRYDYTTLPGDFRVGVIAVLSTVDESAVGSGFIISADGHLVTCTHVINEAKASIDNQVRIRFACDGSIGLATVLREGFMSIEEGDRIFLQALAQLPTTARVLPIIKNFIEGEPFRVYGVPANRSPNGAYGNGVVEALTGRREITWLQLRSDDIIQGFSGAPVWTDRGVAGMIVRRDEPDKRFDGFRGYAYALPTRILIEGRENLFDASSYALQSPRQTRIDAELNIARETVHSRHRLFGISNKISDVLFEDVRLIAYCDRPITLLIGAMGSGKTLCLSKTYVETLRRARASAEMPQPLMIMADTFKSTVHLIERHIARNGTGFDLFIDGFEQLDKRERHQMLVKVRTMTSTSVLGCCVVASREAELVEDQEVVMMKSLSRDSMQKIAESILGHNIDTTFLPESLKQFVEWPLFFLLFLSFSKSRTPEDLEEVTYTDFVHSIVDSALQIHASVDEESVRELRRFAVAGLVADAASRSFIPGLQTRKLVSTGLIDVDQAGNAHFALDIIRDWFVAQSICEGEVTVSDICNSEHYEGSGWITALLLALGIRNDEVVANYLGEIVRCKPWLADEVISQINNWVSPAPSCRPKTSLEAARLMRKAIDDWLTAQPDLAPLFWAMRGTKVYGARVDDRNMLTTGWYFGRQRPRYLEIPTFGETLLVAAVREYWNDVAGRRVTWRAGWQYEHTKGEVRATLSRVFTQNLKLRALEKRVKSKSDDVQGFLLQTFTIAIRAFSEASKRYFGLFLRPQSLAALLPVEVDVRWSRADGNSEKRTTVSYAFKPSYNESFATIVEGEPHCMADIESIYDAVADLRPHSMKAGVSYRGFSLDLFSGELTPDSLTFEWLLEDLRIVKLFGNLSIPL